MITIEKLRKDFILNYGLIARAQPGSDIYGVHERFSQSINHGVPGHLKKEVATKRLALYFSWFYGSSDIENLLKQDLREIAVSKNTGSADGNWYAALEDFAANLHRNDLFRDVPFNF